MVDIHSHIIWGVDDGAHTREESLSMLRAAAESGTTEIVATPHANARFEFQRGVVEARIAELAAASGGIPAIHCGCEFHLTFDNIDALLEQPRLYTIRGGRYLLVECPDSHIGRHTESIFERILDADLVPIIAHPERNPVLRNELNKLERWVEMGCLTQVTALSLMGTFGNSAKTASIRMLRRGLVHVIASDAHDPEHRSPRMEEAYRIVSARHGEEASEILFTETPRAIVADARLAGGRQITWEPALHWYQFWKSG